MEQRPYFAYAFYDLHRWRVLLLLPLTRIALALLHGMTPTVYRYEMALGIVFVTYALMKWRSCRYRLSKTADGRFHTIGVRQGIFVRRTLHISAEDAASVEIERTPLLWLFGGRRILVSTAGLRRRADARLYVSAEQADALFCLKHRHYDYRAPRWPVLVMSLTGSNAAVGLLTVAPVLRQSGRVLGEQVTQNVVGMVGQLIDLGLPSALRTAGNVLIIGWGVSAARNFFRYVGFRAFRDTTHLHLSSGLFTHRDVLIDRDKITALELRQTLTMRIFSLYTAIVTAAGYGRDIGTRPVLIPAARPHDLGACLDRLLPGFPIYDCLLRPVRQSRWRYIAAPLVLFGIGGVLWFLGAWWHGPALLWAVFSLWWLLVRSFGFARAGFGCGGGSVSLCYPRGLALYRVYLPREVIDSVVVTQSRYQQRRGTCSVKVRCFGEKKRTHRVWGLPYDAVRRELRRYEQ